MAKLINSQFFPVLKEENKNFQGDTWQSLTRTAFQIAIGGGCEANINYSVNAKHSPKMFKSAGVYLNYFSSKIPFDDGFLNPDKEELFMMNQFYHKKLASNVFSHQFHNKSLYGNLLSVFMLNNS